jgi:hypothetical protein
MRSNSEVFTAFWKLKIKYREIELAFLDEKKGMVVKSGNAINFLVQLWYFNAPKRFYF